MSDLKVGDFVTLQRGKTYKGPLVGHAGPALLGLGSIVPGGGFRDDYKTYGGDCPPELMLVPGDLFVSLKGATKDGEMIGSIARLPATVPSGRLTQDTVRLVFRERDDSFEKYLYWLLRTPDYRRYCAARATGSAVVALSREDFLSYPVPPVTAVRHEIVGVLERIESKIESNNRLIGTATQILDARATCLAHFPSVPLRSLVSLQKGTIKPSSLGTEIVDHFSLPAFDEGALPARVAADTIMSNKTAFASEAILISRLNPRIERTWWASPSVGFQALTSTEFACLTARGSLDLGAIWLAVRDPFFRNELPRRVTGTSGSHQRVRPDDLLNIEVPDVSELPAADVARSRDVLEVIAQRRRESARLAACRTPLLQGLHLGSIQADSNLGLDDSTLEATG